ncbi:nicotinate-nucleotide adenylyltransferase [Acetobacter sp. TBRC 12305]|uniref:Probable nicotinate-nucleotide adenylyltransferase n=2 Tax=Acetobacter garciniae TaxID=2817435 RepID=A0A939HPU4_9PROT|nr:nicotinate-nucleotide adenylyltransferase [Acetobacter garciniae]MBX0346277.1 nicotinate-nucleotide adenylyltransferase [Acetobacter garciniae]
MQKPMPDTAATRIPEWGDTRCCRIGLLGGSFNPGHVWHRAIAYRALVELQLDQVWLMVSPGNPLKVGQDMAPFALRLTTARQLADGRRVVATDIEARIGTRYTVDTIRILKNRFPRARFVWLTGADGFAGLSLWKGWRRLVHCVPIAVFPRPGVNARALRGAAGEYMARWRVPARQAGRLASLSPPAWAFLPGVQNSISATQIRQQGGFRVPADQSTPPDLRTTRRKTGEQS